MCVSSWQMRYCCLYIVCKLQADHTFDKARSSALLDRNRKTFLDILRPQELSTLKATNLILDTELVHSRNLSTSAQNR